MEGAVPNERGIFCAGAHSILDQGVPALCTTAIAVALDILLVYAGAATRLLSLRLVYSGEIRLCPYID